MNARAVAFVSVITLAGGFDGFAQDNGLKKVRQRMADSIGITQDFLCSASVQRSIRTGATPASTLPALNFETGMINGKELYAWPSTDADVAALKELIAQYSNWGTAAFGLYTRPLFVTNSASFYPAADETKGGRRLLKFEFAMPRESSKYTMSTNGTAVTLGYSGFLWADPDKLDVVSMELHADNIPPDAGLKDLTQTFEYGRTRLGLSTVMLPVASEVAVKEASGRELHVATKFDSCRLYTTQAGMRFIEGVIEREPEAVSGARLPSKTTLDLILEDPIDERTSTPGTSLSLRLARDVKSGGRVLIRKGSPATAKVTRVSRQSYRAMGSIKGYYILGIQLESIDADGQKYSVVANLDTVGPATTITCFLPFSESPDKWGQFLDVRDQLDFPNPLSGEAIIGVVREYLRVPKNIRMVWVTK